MSALRASLVMIVLLPMLASAGWRPISTVTPPVTDVQLAVDAGVVVAVSPSGVTAWQASDGGVLATLAGAYVGGGFYGSNCILALTPTGTVTPSSGACGTATSIATGNWVGFKVLSSPPLSVAVRATVGTDELFAGPGAAAGWNSAGLVSSSNNRTLQTRQIDGRDYVVLNSAIAAGVSVSVDAGMPSSVAGTQNWRDAAPVPLNGAPALLGTTTTALLLVRDYRSPGAAITLSSPAGIAPRYVSSSGRAAMATTTTGVVLAPIPNPARPLETWVVRSAPDSGVGGKVHCMEDRACVASNDAGVIWLWTNDVAPTVSLLAAVQPDGGLRLTADAGDGDGDPIFVSWDAGPAGLLNSVAGVEDGTQAELSLPACTAATIQAVVTDGLPGHERSALLSLDLPPGELLISGGAPSVPAGGGPLLFSAITDGGCGAPTITWTASDGGSGSGSSYSWSPPATECNSDGGLITITATATWPGSSTSSASQQVIVEPWGAPATPAFTSGGTQQPNTTVEYFSQGIEHQCTGSPFFPGTELVWSIDAGGLDPMAVTPIPGGLRITAPSSCVEHTVTASAYRRLSGQDAGARSLDSNLLVVTIPDDATPLDSTTPFSITVNGDAGVLFGELLIDAGCLAERGVSAHVSASRGGTIASEEDFQHDGGAWTWDLEIAGGCLGGTFDVLAELELDGGVRTTAQGSFTLPFTPVIVGAQSVSALDVVCGLGARGTVALLPEPNSCASADLEWRVSGVAVVTPSGSGETFELQTEALDFSTVGQQVTVEWSADAGPGNADSKTHTIALGVQPFLEVERKTFPPLRREEEALTLEVTVRNTTSCAVDGLSVTLPISGGSPIADSILIDGVKRTARETDTGLVVDGVSVPAEGTSVIRLSVRPRLLSTATVEPVATLNGYVVSTTLPDAVAGTGCGCSTADLSMMLGVLLLFVRRRRA